MVDVNLTRVWAASLRVCIIACLLGWLAIYVPSPSGNFGAKLCVCHICSPRIPTERKMASSWWADLMANGMPNRLPQRSFHSNVGFYALSTSSIVIDHKRQG